MASLSGYVADLSLFLTSSMNSSMIKVCIEKLRGFFCEVGVTTYTFQDMSGLNEVVRIMFDMELNESTSWAGSDKTLEQQRFELKDFLVPKMANGSMAVSFI